MNKIFALLLTAVFALTGAGSMATSTDISSDAATSADLAADVSTTTDLVSPVYEISGTVTEIGEGYVVFQDQDGVMVQANINDDTAMMLDLPESTLALGDYVTVVYNGMMTRSLPGQITALALRSALRTGEITQIGEGFFMLKTDVDEFQVNCTPEQLADLALSTQVKVYFSGVMTMSLPAQISAELIVPVQ